MAKEKPKRSDEQVLLPKKKSRIRGKPNPGKKKSSTTGSPFTPSPKSADRSTSRRSTSQTPTSLGTPKSGRKTSASSYPYPGYPRHHRDQHGYPVSKESSKGYSAEDKHKRYKDHDQYRKHRSGSDYSPECYIFSLVVLFLLVGLLSFVTYSLYEITYPGPTIRAKPRGYHYETNRSSLVIMSDNFDCSLYMKKLAMNKMELRAVMMGGLQCLHINEPHSVAPDSAVSLFFYYKYDHETISRMTESEGKKGPCTFHTERCTPSTLRSFLASNVRVNDQSFQFKEFSSEWLITGNFYKTYYQALFRRLARFSDTGSKEYTYPNPEIFEPPKYKEIREPTRIFRVSGLFDKMLRNKREKGKTTANIPFSTNYTALSSVHHFIYDHGNLSLGQWPPKLRLRGQPGKTLLAYYIYYPRGSTHSVISAFIVKIVYNYYVEYIEPTGTKISEAMLLAWVMKAQKLAYHFFVGSREWSEEENAVSMMARTGIAVKHMANGSLPENLLKPRRINVDRSVSIVAWERTNKEEINILGLSLPSLFGSRFVQDANPGNYSSFTIDNTATTNIPPSAPFSSHASLIIMEELNLDPDTEHIQMVASCSGSVRNAEAVATSVLYQLIFKQRPAKAAWFGGIYYDVRDGKFYCDYNGVKSDYKRYSSYFKPVYEEAQLLAGIKCRPIGADDHAANDRLVLLASRRPSEGHHGEKRAHVVNDNPFMTAAVDPRAEEYNYAVGY